MRRFSGFIVSALFLALSEPFSMSGKWEPEISRPFFRQSQASSQDEARLAKILEKSAAYCDRLENSSLHFVCLERIEEEIHYRLGFGRGGDLTSSLTGGIGWKMGSIRPGTKVKADLKNNFVYDYQLAKRGDGIAESRALLEENGEKKEEKNASLKTWKFFSYKPIFGPVGFLAREWQGTYDYKFFEEDTLDGVNAIVIEIRPKVFIEGKPNFGKIWVDGKDGSVLRIDVEQESLVGFKEIQAQAKANRLKPQITTSHVFGFEKNGLRFPSRTVFEESYIDSKKAKTLFSRTVFSYEEYKFFIVSTEVVIK